MFSDMINHTYDLFRFASWPLPDLNKVTPSVQLKQTVQLKEHPN